MSESVIGAQLFTLRDHLKTPADIAKTLARVSKMGFEAVQVSAVGEIETKELAKILKDNGLTCAATHVPLDKMKDIQACLDYHAELDCQYTAIGGYFDKQATTQQAWFDFAKQYNDITGKLAAKGLYAGYHNHSHELAPIEGRPALDILIEKCNQDVWFEIDTYWIAHGGGDPAAWITRCKDRIPCVHVKDMTITLDREQKMCEVGKGNLNWPAILQACKDANVKWYLIERDSGELDPFDSLEISLKSLKDMGLN